MCGRYILSDMTTWNDIFEPVRKASGGLEDRPQQRMLGDAIIQTLEDESTLLGNAPTGSGKSFATLVPAIDYVKKKKQQVVFSVTTLALQDQIISKDLPFLHKVYGGFSYSSLKGRGQYLCLNHMEMMSRGNSEINKLYLILDGASLHTGERSEVELRVGKINDFIWDSMCGESKRCSEFKCESSRCFGTKARDNAQGKDIIVVNHSVLVANQETKALGGGFLGDFPVLIVDEAHELENSIISMLSNRVNEWEIQNYISDILKGVRDCESRGLVMINGRKAQASLEALYDGFCSIVDFYYRMCEYRGDDWRFESSKITKKVVPVRAPQELKDAGNRLSGEVLDGMYDGLMHLLEVHRLLSEGYRRAVNLEETGLRKISKSINQTKRFYELMRKIFEACDTSQGYSVEYGVPYAVILNGYYNRKDEVKGSIETTPLAISEYAKELFNGKTCIFVSATLKDLSKSEDKKFDYFIKSMGLEDRNVETLDLEAVFDYSSQQLVYISGDSYSLGRNRIKGVKYSLEELYDLIMTARGRALVLFTSKAELEEAYTFLCDIGLPFPILAQGKDMDKQELVNEFMSKTNSVLLGSKSFFTGVDFHGEACSLVVLVKFPNPRFDDLCKLRLNWWTKKGYPGWYEREALNVFQQGAGRLIRKGNDFGVVAILDKRATNKKERVHASVGKGVTALGSPVTRKMNDVDLFLGGKL